MPIYLPKGARGALPVPMQPVGLSAPSTSDLAAMLTQVQRNQGALLKAIQDVQWNQSILAEMIGEICVVMSPDNANAIAGIVLGAGGSLRSD
jgi:hypothetical protein